MDVGVLLMTTYPDKIYRKGNIKGERNQDSWPENKKCPACLRLSLRYNPISTSWNCTAKDCYHVTKQRDGHYHKIHKSNLNHIAIEIEKKWEASEKTPDNLTSDKIKERIKEVLEKRENFLKEVKSFLLKRNDCVMKGEFNEYTVNNPFLTYILKKEGKLKKKKISKDFKDIALLLRHYDYTTFKIVAKGEKSKKVFRYIAPKWVIVRKSLELVMKYGEGFCISKYQKQLEDLTKCQVDKYNKGINPCTCICEKCGVENQISANYCSQCGGKLS